ncbi:MAG TPA: MFS transporter [Pseudogracilibacillus sp.]|nr:MFS transporter [Pseudogracilibacillus sp.]
MNFVNTGDGRLVKSGRSILVILNSIIIIAGFTQGMLLTVLSVILDQEGVSALMNGVHASALYIGILLMAPFIEKPLYQYGYKRMMLFGASLVIVSLFLFPAWMNIWFWLILRMTIGMGIEMLHISSQTWITSMTMGKNRGTILAIYGLSFGLGFTIGPMMVRLVTIWQQLPFLVSGGLIIAVLLAIVTLPNEKPEHEASTFMNNSFGHSFGRFFSAWKIAWVSFLCPFAYGFMEAALSGVFPAYGLQLGYNVETLSIILPCFAFGSIIFQIPIGMLSDRVDRRKILTSLVGLGTIAFFMLTFFEQHLIWMMVLLTLAGVFVGTLFSLGISYMGDLLPNALLPAGNVICSVLFSMGSMVGPFLGGIFIKYLPDVSFFYIFVLMLFVLTVSLMLFRKKTYIAEG